MVQLYKILFLLISLFIFNLAHAEIDPNLRELVIRYSEQQTLQSRENLRLGFQRVLNDRGIQSSLPALDSTELYAVGILGNLSTEEQNYILFNFFEILPILYPQLIVLNLSFNDLHHLPENAAGSLKQLIHLRRLDLSGNCLKYLPGKLVPLWLKLKDPRAPYYDPLNDFSTDPKSDLRNFDPTQVTPFSGDQLALGSNYFIKKSLGSLRLSFQEFENTLQKSENLTHFGYVEVETVLSQEWILEWFEHRGIIRFGSPGKCGSKNCVYFTPEEIETIRQFEKNKTPLHFRPVAPLTQLEVLEIRTAGGDYSGLFSTIRVRSSAGEEYLLNDPAGMITQAILFRLFQNQVVLSNENTSLASPMSHPLFEPFRAAMGKTIRYFRHSITDRRPKWITAGGTTEYQTLDQEYRFLGKKKSRCHYDCESFENPGNPKEVFAKNWRAYSKYLENNSDFFVASTSRSSNNPLSFNLDSLNPFQGKISEIQLTGNLHQILKKFHQSLGETPLITVTEIEDLGE